MFQPGDKVLCLESQNRKRRANVTKGHIYTVRWYYRSGVISLEETGTQRFSKTLFKKVEHEQ